jgi:hypothetical protein
MNKWQAIRNHGVYRLAKGFWRAFLPLAWLVILPVDYGKSWWWAWPICTGLGVMSLVIVGQRWRKARARGAGAGGGAGRVGGPAGFEPAEPNELAGEFIATIAILGMLARLWRR